MKLLKELGDAWMNPKSYSNSGRNELCRNEDFLNRDDWQLTCNEVDGIHQEHQVTSQDIYYQDTLASTAMHLQFHYIEINKSLIDLNIARVAIYMPFETDNSNWFRDELEMEKWNESE